MSRPNFQVHMAIATARAEGRLEACIDDLLNLCPDMECSVCAFIICPHKDTMHFHHDGCPSCSEDHV